MFEFAPVAMAITTSSLNASRYVKVNDAYLRLTGMKWEDIKGERVITSGDFLSPQRLERRRLLDEEGGYELQEVELTHADGTRIPTLISAQRTEVGARSYDVEIILDISARAALQREMDAALIAAARTDVLTGLPNRAGYDHFIASSVASATSNGNCLILAFIDLNGFKYINDTFGHSTGDHVLKIVGQRLRDGCRESDFVARLGGDEFVVVLTMKQQDSEAAFPAFQRLMNTIFKPMDVNGTELSIGAAIGTAHLDAGVDTAETLLNRADRCMYEAKLIGGVNIVTDIQLA
ncbi:hypothetical protein WH87_01565 [Devosia epidermidihirudinis]|uniref:GGDEF domain-containing protein n=2 Tax=Devosia epidermidihirudinis TaxID=1293439 RepID=A0A0F5QM39_9HYPH|nr:hypothetical protein WH87_01565 [Devosia epidermidihirudinis]